MTIISLLLLSLMVNNSLTLADFDSPGSLNNWYIVDDGVMGGRSNGEFYLDSEGHGIYSGYVSLENNGGFSSVRHIFKTINVEELESFVLKVKGDGKKYQLRVKSQRNQYYSYSAEFKTNGSWQTIVLPFKDFSPVFRGRLLDIPNYAGEMMEEISILIGNKKQENFKLIIDKIELQ